MNNSVNATTQKTPTELLYGTPVRLFPSFQQGGAETPVPAVSEYIDRILESIAIAKDNHVAAKTTQTKYANKSRRAALQYKEGDLVMLDSRNIRKHIKQRGRSAKLYPRFLGPFKVIKARPETSNYKLELLPAVDFQSIHPNFHAKLLRPYVPNDPDQFPAREPARPPPIIPEDNQYIVDHIRDHKIVRRKRQFLVRWEGYDESHDEWVKEEDIDKALVEEYIAMVEQEG
jgi:hypothetical protein